MVEQKGVEPSTYTMRTYRSSQLSYCPIKLYYVIYINIQKNQMLFLRFHKIFPIKNPVDAPARSHDHSFEVLQKYKIGNFSVVTLQAATLVYYSPVIRSSPLLREWVLKTRRSKR